jgi:hypothetical protein
MLRGDRIIDRALLRAPKLTRPIPDSPSRDDSELPPAAGEPEPEDIP